jgi:hypothetical protein
VISRDRWSIGRRWGLVALVLGVVLGCRGERDAAGADGGDATGDVNAPDAALVGAELLVAAGDSTYWVRIDAGGARVRSAPILLAWHGDRLHELRLEEEIVDYLDAEFIRERLWAHPLDGADGDSVLLFRDDAVENAERAWRLRFPDEAPLDPDAEDVPEPSSSASDFVEVLEVHGPWVSWAHALDVDVVGVGGHEHRRTRGVSSVRSGARATLDSLWPASDARVLRAAGRAAFDTIMAVIARTGEDDERAARARRTLGSFRFDDTSFSLTDSAGTPAVRFHVTGLDEDGEPLELTLPPVVAGTVPDWWPPVRETLGEWSSDSSDVTWARGALRLRGVVDSTRRAVRLTLEPSSPASGPGASLPIATVPLPVYQFLDVRAVRLPSRVRAALEAAFDRARAEDPLATRATWPVRRTPLPLVRTSFE